MDFTKVKVDAVSIPFETNVKVYLLRLDLIDEDISGNKYFKLKHNLTRAIQEGKNSILTFGGAFSNHIAATAAACKNKGLKSIGIIRGEAVNNHTLDLAVHNGMNLHFVSREIYRNEPLMRQFLTERFDLRDIYLIPEGGANPEAIEGCKEITSHINIPFNYIAVACGTGATLTGIIKSMAEDQKALGFSVLKGAFMEQTIQRNLGCEHHSAYKVFEEYHFGGYAKYNETLISFIKDFELRNQIKLDFVYTAKMMFGLFELIKRNYFQQHAVIVAVHSGGLQGNKGIGL